MIQFQTLTEAFLDAEKTDRSITLIGTEQNVISLTYAELLQSARRYAGVFKANGLKKGDRALIAAKDQSVFFGAFWGAILSGAAAIPVIPPISGYSDQHSPELQRLQHIIQISQPALVITDEADAAMIQAAAGGYTAVLPLSDDTVESYTPCIDTPDTEADDTAVILFTSGSTAMPKGVPITHAQAIAGALSNAERLGVTENSCFLNWLPTEHISTLFMLHIIPVILHAEQVHIMTSEILADPKRLLVLLDRYKVNMTFAPNFFCRLLLSQQDDIRQLPVSLTQMTVFINGGEMIHYNTASACVRLLEEKGFRPEAMTPGWGMTETVYGAVYSSGMLPDTCQECVSVGKPVGGVELRLTKDGSVCTSEDIEGSLEIRGDWIFSGYLNESEEEHMAHFTSDGWFRTGDLAVIQNGDLFITGRESDILIINGVNYSIMNMEETLRKTLPEQYYDSIIKLCAVKDEKTGSDMLFIFAEQKPGDDPSEMIVKIRRAAEEAFGFSVSNVYSVPSDSIPKTGIGKIDRKSLVKNAKAGRYASVSARKQISAEELTDEENLILFIWAEILDIDKKELTPDDDFFLIGGDSARVPQVLQRINSAFSTNLNAAQFVRYSTVRSLLEFLNMDNDSETADTNEDSEEIIVL